MTRQREMKKNVRFIDLFAGIGGIRRGFEAAFNKLGFGTECVLTSEIKPYAVKVLQANYPGEQVKGDITKIDAADIPDFDFLLAGFPCQAFSYAGRRLGFQTQKIGRTLTVILSKLNELGYNVSWKVLNSKDFGLAQERKRIYIIGTLKSKIQLDGFAKKHSVIADILEHGCQTVDTKFTKQLLTRFTEAQLYGKSIKDKRGGDDNIHSWDIGVKGLVTTEQKKLLDMMLRERRKKKWALMHGIEWMDGMPLTEKMISEFYPADNLKVMLNDLVEKGYLKKEHPKALVTEHTVFGERKVRKQDKHKEAGYNIVAGKLSFEINKILDPQGIAPTLVAMDMKKIYVIDNGGLRPITLREGLRLFGYSDDFKFPVTQDEGFDLLGNTVAVPVIAAIAEKLAMSYMKS